MKLRNRFCQLVFFVFALLAVTAIARFVTRPGIDCLFRALHELELSDNIAYRVNRNGAWYEGTLWQDNSGAWAWRELTPGNLVYAYQDGAFYQWSASQGDSQRTNLLPASFWWELHGVGSPVPLSMSDLSNLTIDRETVSSYSMTREDGHTSTYVVQLAADSMERWARGRSFSIQSALRPDPADSHSVESHDSSIHREFRDSVTCEDATLHAAFNAQGQLSSLSVHLTFSYRSLGEQVSDTIDMTWIVDGFNEAGFLQEPLPVQATLVPAYPL